MIAIEAKVTGRGAELLAILGTRIGPAGRTELHRAAGLDVSKLLQTHIRTYAKTHHKTADNITDGPAKYSQHLSHAAESVTSDATALQGTVTIESPGFRRAFGPLPIVPRRRKWLTIPLNAASYNQTVDSMRRAGWEIFRPGDRELLFGYQRGGIARRVAAAGSKFFGGGRKSSKTVVLLYALKKGVTLKHEPELMPENDAIGKAAAGAVGKRIKEIAKAIGFI